MRLFIWFILQNVQQQRLRSVATVASLSVGVAVVVAIQLANMSSVRGFSAVLDAVAGRTSLEITAPGVGVPEERLAALGWLREFGFVSPVVDADVLLVPTVDGDRDRFETVRLLGIDILRDLPFRDYPLVDGARARRITTQEFLGILTDTDAVVLTQAFSDKYGLEVGDAVAMVVGDRTTTLRLAAVLANDGPAQVLGGNFALMDIAAAQWALDRFGFVDRLDIRVHEDLDIAEAEQDISAQLPAGLDVGRPGRRGAEVERMLRAFHFNLTALSFVALLVGLFLVYNTVSVSVITRQNEIGMLRTMGVSQGTILALFLGEAGAMAVVGILLGVPLGWLLAEGAVGLTSSTVSQFWVASAAQVPPLTWDVVWLAFGIAVPLALAAALLPAYEAARVAPMAAVRVDAAVQARDRFQRRYLYVPAGLFVAAWWMAQQDAIDGLPVFGLMSALAIVFGAAFLIPALLYGFRVASSGLMVRWFRVEGHLAHVNLASAISRLSVSVAALAVSLAMMVAIAVMVGSFRETVVYWVGQTLQADLFVSTARNAPVGDRGSIGRDTEALIASHSSVLAVDAFTGVDVRYGETPIVVGAGRFQVMVDHGALAYKAPADGPRAMAGAIGTDAVVVSEAFSLKHGVSVDDVISLPTPQGETRFRVAAIYFDYSNDRGIVVMDTATFTQHFSSPRPSGLTVYLEPDADANRIRDELQVALGPDRRLFISTNATLRGEVLRIFDSTFAITYALEAIAIAVSMFGIAATLLTLVLERRREIAMLRLVGLERYQLRRMIVIEAGVLGVVTQVVGLVVGLALSLLLIYVINVQSFGWTIQFHAPLPFLAQSTLAILVATTIAGLYPARLAGRFDLSDVTGGQE